MTGKEAEIIVRLIDYGTESNWPRVRDQLLDSGYNPKEVVSACKTLTNLAGCTTLIQESDF